MNKYIYIDEVHVQLSIMYTHITCTYMIITILYRYLIIAFNGYNQLPIVSPKLLKLAPVAATLPDQTAEPLWLGAESRRCLGWSKWVMVIRWLQHLRLNGVIICGIIQSYTYVYTYSIYIDIFWYIYINNYTLYLLYVILVENSTWIHKERGELGL
jgi:hypothetical protein